MPGYKLLATAIAVSMFSTPAVADDTSESECPELLRDSRLELADTAGGTTFTLTTPHADYVPILRLAMREAASVVQQRTVELAANRTEPAIPVVSIAVRDVRAGVVVTIRARKAADVGLLRLQSKMLKSMWQSSCLSPKRPRLPGSVSA